MSVNSLYQSNKSKLPETLDILKALKAVENADAGSLKVLKDKLQEWVIQATTESDKYFKTQLYNQDPEATSKELTIQHSVICGLFGFAVSLFRKEKSIIYLTYLNRSKAKEITGGEAAVDKLSRGDCAYLEGMVELLKNLCTNYYERTLQFRGQTK